jgi:hypothetical protein
MQGPIPAVKGAHDEQAESRFVILSVAALVGAVPLLHIARSADEPRKDADTRSDVQKQLDDMKASFDKLAEENHRLADQLLALRREHADLRKRFEANVTVVVGQMEGLKDIDAKTNASLQSLGIGLTNLTNTLDARTSALSIGGTVINLDISEIRFQPDGNVVIVGKTSRKVHWATGTNGKR